MNDSFDALYKDTPEIIESLIEMAEPNMHIHIYQGQFVISQEEKKVTVNGEIKFHWFPNKGTKFSGNSDGDFGVFFSLFNSVRGERFPKLYINEFEVGNCQITSLGSSVEGVLTGRVIIGDKSISVSKVRFSIPNLLELNGTLVKKTFSDKKLGIYSRLKLENEDYLFLIDKVYDYKNTTAKLKDRGGFIIQYAGELIKHKGNLTLEEAREIFSCLNNFLTFLNGRRTSALFSHGIHNEDILWSDFTPYHVDTYKSVFHWLPSNPSNEINDIWKNFSRMWRNNDAKDFLTSAIHWYVEVNKNSGFVIGSIVTAQIALELIYNWLIIEKKKLLIGKDAENISTANKIRLLISYIGVDYEVPHNFKSLNEYIKSNKDVKDAPDAIVLIRNYIVHSQADKRKNLSSIPNIVLYEGLQLSIWYIELSLLFILNYNGKYQNRCSGAEYAGDTELVPWESK